MGVPDSWTLAGGALGPLGKPVQDGVGHGVVGEDLIPLPERPVRRAPIGLRWSWRTEITWPIRRLAGWRRLTEPTSSLSKCPGLWDV